MPCFGASEKRARGSAAICADKPNGSVPGALPGGRGDGQDAAKDAAL